MVIMLKSYRSLDAVIRWHLVTLWYITWPTVASCIQ